MPKLKRNRRPYPELPNVRELHKPTVERCIRCNSKRGVIKFYDVPYITPGSKPPKLIPLCPLCTAFGREYLNKQFRRFVHGKAK